MKFNLILATFAAASALFTVYSCDKHAPTQTVPGNQDNPLEVPDTTGNQNKPDEASFALKVYDISSVSVTVEVEPLDKVSPYYMDVINESDFLQAQKYGFDDYMTWFIGNLMEQKSLTRDEVVKMISSYGNDGFILTTLKPETVYYAFAVGIGDDGMTTTELVYEKFTTMEKETSQNTFSITATDIAPTTATLNVDVSNNDPYIFSIEPANTIAGLTGEEIADYVIQNNMAWGGLGQMTYYGDQQIQWVGKAGWDYVAVAFGYVNGAVTTDVVEFAFSMGEGGDPAGCSFAFDQTFESFQMHLSTVSYTHLTLPTMAVV